MTRKTRILHCMITNNSTVSSNKDGFYFKMYKLNEKYKNNLVPEDPLILLGEMFYLDFSDFFHTGVVLNGEDSEQVSLSRDEFKQIITLLEEPTVGEGLTVSKYLPPEERIKNIFIKENALRKMVQSVEYV